MRLVRRRSSDRITPARTTSAVIGPGGGHHLVKARTPLTPGVCSSSPVMTSADP